LLISPAPIWQTCAPYRVSPPFPYVLRLDFSVEP
jgi:hypothetical protein